MTIALLQISDIHYKESTVLKSIDSIVSVIRGLTLENPTIIIVLSGDCAYSGKKEEYNKFENYILELNEKLQEEINRKCYIVICPGNHDINFPEDNAIRDLVIENIRQSSSMPKSNEMINTCIKGQEEFYKFLNRVTPSITFDNENLSWIYNISTVEGIRIGIRVLNTAWMSTINEKQGSLYYPIDHILQSPDSDLRITVIHHPYNWFNSTNARKLKTIIEKESDIVVSGHEHEESEYMISREKGEETSYIEGGIFNNDKSEYSEINVIVIDLPNSQYSVLQFTWKGTLYSQTNEGEWNRFIFPKSQYSRIDRVNIETQKFLNYPGMQLTHRAKDITLKDIFVPPDLQLYEKIETPDKVETNTISSKDTIEKLFEYKYAYILGDGQCGKTSLGKMLFIEGIEAGRTPIFIRGSEINKFDERHIVKIINEKMGQQYLSINEEEYWQLPPSEKCIIIDEFEDIKINRKTKSQLTEWLKQHFGYVYIFGGELTQIEDLISSSDAEEQLTGYKRFEIKPFGFYLRDILIEKWIRIGKEQIIIEEDISQEIRKTANIVDGILGDHLLPANPIFIILILQQVEAQIPLNIGSGSYGYIYEMILTIALRQTSQSAEDIDGKYTYLSELAWFMHKQETSEIDLETMSQFTKDHCDKYRLEKIPEKLLEEIIDAHIIQLTYNKYNFTYTYFYYYYIARYMRDNTDDSEVSECIDVATRELHREDFINILIFYTYLTKNKTVIRKIIDTAKGLFKEIEPCNLDDHISFINRIQADIPKIFLQENDAKGERRNALIQRDQEEQEKKNIPISTSREVEEGEEIELTISINRAVKVLQILGQILRNFSGSINKDLKVEITQECFSLALRVLNSFYNVLEKHLDPLLLYMAELFGNNLKEVPEKDRVKVAKKFVFNICEIMSFATLKRISSAVGSETLVRIYKDVETIFDNRATRFVQLCLRLDHCGPFPYKRVRDLVKEVSNDDLGLTLLRILVVDHFRMFQRPFQIRESICKILGIPFQRSLQAGGGIITYNKNILERPKGKMGR